MTLPTTFANLSWRSCLLDASYMPPGTLGKCQKFPETQTKILSQTQGLGTVSVTLA